MDTYPVGRLADAEERLPGGDLSEITRAYLRRAHVLNLNITNSPGLSFCHTVLYAHWVQIKQM